MLKDVRVKAKGDWNYLLAYEAGERGDNTAARTYMRRALRSRFSSDELRELARAYKMKLDGRIGDRSSLLADLKWMETKGDPVNADAYDGYGACAMSYTPTGCRSCGDITTTPRPYC